MNFQETLVEYQKKLEEINDINDFLQFQQILDDKIIEADNKISELHQKKNELLQQDYKIEEELQQQYSQIKQMETNNTNKLQQQDIAAQQEQMAELQEKITQILKFGNATIKPHQIKLVNFNQKEAHIELTKVIYNNQSEQENKTQAYDIIFDLNELKVIGIKLKQSSNYSDFQSENISPDIQALWNNDFDTLFTINLNQQFDKH